MVNKLILTLSCLLLTADVSMQASRFATVNLAATTVQNDGSVILNGNSYLGYDEMGYFAKRLYVNNTPTVDALSNTECMVFGIGVLLWLPSLAADFTVSANHPTKKSKIRNNDYIDCAYSWRIL